MYTYVDLSLVLGGLFSQEQWHGGLSHYLDQDDLYSWA